jgi:Ca-activated chloride channel family protein
MLNFAYPEHLYLFILLPLIFLLYWFSRKSYFYKLKKFGNISVLANLMPDASKYKPAIKLCLQLVVATALIIVLCRPQSGAKEASETIAGNEIFIALDVSNSMKASATDDPNGVSRLDKAKLLLEKIVDRLENDKVGLIVFAGDAYLQLPMTTDFISAQQYLNIISTDMVSSQGTAIADAIDMAMNAYTFDENKHKALILITDCEDHIGEAIEKAQEASKQNIQINVIGLGSINGAPIPINNNKTEYMSDYNGQIVKTSLNEQLAKEIAKSGNGIYVNGATPTALNEIENQLDKLAKSELKTLRYKSSAEQFPFFAWIALFFLVFDIFVLDRKISWLKKINFFSK